MTSTPSDETLLSFMLSNRLFTDLGSDDAVMSNLRWMAVDTLLTFCPPAP